MQSIVSLLSVNNNHDHDIAPLDDLEDIPDTESNYDLSEHVLDFTAQLEQLTNSLTGSEVATPMSGELNFGFFSQFFVIIIRNCAYSSITHRRSNTTGRNTALSGVELCRSKIVSE